LLELPAEEVDDDEEDEDEEVEEEEDEDVEGDGEGDGILEEAAQSPLGGSYVGSIFCL
jgi:hypothetical protein